ncbi:MAG: hypothetical protein IV090_19805 [Candidatus Sericytochromatia bacterium]|nr:hypothetical protein [Candidatus Sericytochromatia bacterium]
MPHEYTFFLDRCLGKKYVAKMLEEEGESYTCLDDHFDQDTPDHEWLPETGKNGWVVLTKDQNIRRRKDEYLSLTEANNAVFVYTSGSSSGPDIAEAFKKALPKINRILKKQKRPFIAKVTKSGNVELYATKD